MRGSVILVLEDWIHSAIALEEKRPLLFNILRLSVDQSKVELLLLLLLLWRFFHRCFITSGGCSFGFFLGRLDFLDFRDGFSGRFGSFLNLGRFLLFSGFWGLDLGRLTVALGLALSVILLLFHLSEVLLSRCCLCLLFSLRLGLGIVFVSFHFFGCTLFVLGSGLLLLALGLLFSGHLLLLLGLVRLRLAVRLVTRVLADAIDIIVVARPALTVFSHGGAAPEARSRVTEVSIGFRVTGQVVVAQVGLAWVGSLCVVQEQLLRVLRGRVLRLDIALPSKPLCVGDRVLVGGISRGAATSRDLSRASLLHEFQASILPIAERTALAQLVTVN